MTTQLRISHIEPEMIHYCYILYLNDIYLTFSVTVGFTGAAMVGAGLMFSAGMG